MVTDFFEIKNTQQTNCLIWRVYRGWGGRAAMKPALNGSDLQDVTRGTP